MAFDMRTGEVAAAVDPRVLGLMPLLRMVMLRGRRPTGLERRSRDRRRTIFGLPEQHRARIEASARRRTVPLDRLGPCRAEQLLAGLCVLAEEFGVELERPEARR